MTEPHSPSRACPICGGAPRGTAFPYRTRYNHIEFSYLACGSCRTVFVDPVPDDATFALMYAKAAYHDFHYEGIEEASYAESAAMLARHLHLGACVLDYGCGAGYFLEACSAQGLMPFGVEFDQDEARAAGQRTGCRTYSVREFGQAGAPERFDAIHLGDVLEHLPEPFETLRSLIAGLRPGGVVFLEGPLEVNPSPVYWAALAYGAGKKRLRPAATRSGAPTHLLRTDAPSQRLFFERFGNLRLVEWRTEETGWPYANGGRAKKTIAAWARWVNRTRPLGIEFGNRFRAILVKQANGQNASP